MAHLKWHPLSFFFFFFFLLASFDYGSVLRRCSMEMWCRGDTGRIAGLRHLLGREHDSTPQSGVEAPRL